MKEEHQDMELQSMSTTGLNDEQTNEIEPLEGEGLKRQRMDEIQGLLASTDYIVLKKAEGIDISEYNEQYDGDFLSWRQGLRDEYNKLEGLNNQEQ